MAKKLPRAREAVTQLIKSSLAQPVISDWLAKRRRLELPEFLAAAMDTPAQTVLGDPAGSRDAFHHLLVQWPTTVQQIARPDSLPAVRERRERVRVHPLAPVSTAALSAAGAVAVTQGSWAAPLEAAGIVGVVAVTAWGALPLWKPRARAKDRHFTMVGTPALLARGQTELAEHPLAALTTSDAVRTVADQQLTQLVASGRQLEDLEREAATAGLLDEAGALRNPARTPAEQGLIGEVVARRLELLQAVVGLSTAGYTERAQQRTEERTGYGLEPQNEAGSATESP